MELIKRKQTTNREVYEGAKTDSWNKRVKKTTEKKDKESKDMRKGSWEQEGSRRLEKKEKNLILFLSFISDENWKNQKRPKNPKILKKSEKIVE